MLQGDAFGAIAKRERKKDKDVEIGRAQHIGLWAARYRLLSDGCLFVD